MYLQTFQELMSSGFCLTEHPVKFADTGHAVGKVMEVQ